MTANLCPVCRRLPISSANLDGCNRNSIDDAEAGACEYEGRVIAERERDAALDALRRVGCLRYTREFPAPCKPEDEDTCSRCRGLWAGTPPGPAPPQSGSNGFQRAAPVSRDAVLEEAALMLGDNTGWGTGEAARAVRLLKSKEPA
jgi:hypothetical protein